MDVDSDPLDGGSEGLEELLLLDESGQSVRLIDLIRDETGNAGLSRADLRFSLGTPGEVFVLNEYDGVVRRLVAVPEPSTVAVLAVAAGLFSQRRRFLRRTQ